MKNDEKLFQPISRNGVDFKNAIAMAPMTRSRSIGNIPNKLVADYYAQRTSAGLIITEGNAPSADGIGYSRTPGIYSEEQIEGWRVVTDAVHRRGGKIFTQLMHVGRISHEANKPAGGRTVAPSAIAANGVMWTDQGGLQPYALPEEMTGTDIKQVITDFMTASRNAIAAGFDGVEFHGANGYLFEQFLNPNSNVRTDEYGGSIVNRIRLLLEVVKSVSDVIGKEKVGVRVSPYGTYNDMLPYDGIFETYSLLSTELSKLDILYLHVVSSHAKSADGGTDLLSTIRTNFKNLLILNGGYNIDSAIHSLQHEGADMISFGSPFISNPDLPHRLKHGLSLATPNTETFFTAGETGYTDYPVVKEVLSER